LRHKQFYILALFLVFTGIAFGQGKLKNQPKYDKRAIHFGFCLGIFTNDFKIDPVEDLASVPGYYGWTTNPQPGYKIGIVSNLRLSDHWDFRFIPSFATSQRDIIFDVTDPNTGERKNVEREVQSSFVESPFELKFKSDRINNYRWYLLGGVKHSLDLASKKKVEDDNIFKIENNDFAVEFGVGLDFYFEFFKFSPQIKASWGVRNLLVEDGTYLVEGIDGVYSRSILINFTFE
jgi:hypothetical protein